MSPEAAIQSRFREEPAAAIRAVLATLDEVPLGDLPALCGCVAELSARIRLRINLAANESRAGAEEEDQEIGVEEARKRFFPAYSKSWFYRARLPFMRQRGGRGSRITCSTAAIRRYLRELETSQFRTARRTANFGLCK